ncbi:DUF4350 domain-containing protein [Arthrobacter halodurans]|uniref:DUF4350 domain-containing protein n=1 Tax=Arthrobacter halodurans TaxID=516699 RepID=A0ABV4UIP8_9MICC
MSAEARTPLDGTRTVRAQAPDSARSVGLRRWRGARLWLALVALAVAAGLFYALTGTGADRVPLSPRNPAPDGAMAVAEVLGRHGVGVVVPGSLDAAVDAARDPAGATVLLHDPGAILNDAQLERLAAASRRAVLIGPGFDQLRPFSDDIRPAGVVPEDAASPSAASCGAPVAAEAPAVSAGGTMYTGGAGCFAHARAGAPAHSLAVDGTTTVLGNPAFLENGRVLDHGHAALALWTLGAEPTLVWYQPTVADLVSEGPPASPFELLPSWFGPAAAWLMFVGLVAILWRARRDGPLVAEPLPVVVPSAETAEGRARLYQDARAVEAAAASLRSASLTRIAAHLRLGQHVTADGVIATLAKSGHRPESELRRLLHPADVTTEKRLVAWANELHTLEQEIGIP